MGPSRRLLLNQSTHPRVIIASRGGGVPPAQNKRSDLPRTSGGLILTLGEDLISLTQLTVLPLKRLDAIPFSGRHTVAHPAVFLGLLDPFAQGLRNTADLRCNGRNRARLRFLTIA